MVVKVYKKGEIQQGRPLAGFWVHAAFESPGTDYEEDRISLDEYVSNLPPESGGQHQRNLQNRTNRSSNEVIN